MKLKRLCLVFILLSFASFVSAQNNKELLCRVMEYTANYAVPYATIQFEKTNKGVISNLEGDFRIPYRYKLDKDILIISCIGYETKKIALTTLQDNIVNIIYLKPKVELLEAVIIKGKKKLKTALSGYQIVKKAIGQIPNNYPNSSFSLMSYYRDYQVVNGKYYNLNESLIESFDAGFETDAITDTYNEAALFKYKNNTDFLRDSILLQTYDGKSKYIENVVLSGQGGNELGILNIHDPIRNYEQMSFSYAYVFKKVFSENHKFKLLRKLYLNDEIIYEIEFYALKDITGINHKASGKIYISKSTFAIHKLVYKLYDAKLDKPRFEVTIEYALKDDKMFLNYLTFNNTFSVESDFVFDVVSIEYEPIEGAFFVTFNSPVLESSLDRRDFRLKYEKEKLVIKNISIIDKNRVKLTLDVFSIPKKLKQESPDMEAMDYRIKNILDVFNRKLYKSPKISGYQFRELFVQEAKPNFTKPDSLKFLKKRKPLSEAPINIDSSKESYWLNSPLKTINN